jgi:organic radical activating enzyme
MLTVIFLDYYIENLKLTIEFNGDLWHGNPEIYKNTDRPNPFHENLTTSEIWEKDRKRKDYLKTKYDIDTIIIWEKDYKKDGMDITIKKLLEEIKKYERL